jgi:hypothetical protein
MFVCPECGETRQVAGYCPADGSPLQPRGDDVLLGAPIGSYRVARLLGVGGMGRVYKGVHPGIGSRVAIKVLSHDCTQNRELVERFFAEARAVNLIRHEAIVNVFDLSTLPDGRPYIVMEYLDGASLADVLDTQGAQPLAGFARLVGQVLDALSSAHARAIVHRDLKPDNIFVSPQGRAKVLDFGIAKLMPELSGRTGPTRTGSLLGTPHYMAPEQAMARNVDPRTDVYAMGVILFEGVTGQRPFQGESLFELLHKHVNEPPPRPRSLRPDLPPDYEALILCAMAKDPGQRFQSAADLARALEHAIQSLPPHAWAAVTPGRGHGASAPLHTPAYSPGAMHTPLPTPVSHAGGLASQASLAGGLASQASLAAASGQVAPQGPGQQPRTSGSRRALWWLGGLALAGLVSGGVALAVLGGDDPGASERSRSGRAGGGAGADSLADVERSLEALAREVEALETLAPTDRLQAAQKLSQEAMALAEKRAQEAMAGALGTGSATLAQPYVLPGTYVPAGFDPKRFDVTGFLPEARAKARGHYEDAELVRIDAYGVYPSGLADLTLADDYFIIYHYNSPSRARRPDDLPRGVKHEPNCKFYVWVSAAGVRPYPLDGWECKEPLLGEPRCSAREVWKQAIAKGAPADNAVAQMSYHDWDGKARWYLTIGDDYSDSRDDSCQ